MISMVTWRGQVPAWQCDPDGRWNVRHAAGAFEEANRIAAMSGAAAGPVELKLDPATCPMAGNLVEVRSDVTGSILNHVMVDLSDGRELMRATAACAIGPSQQNLSPEPSDEAIPGPLNIVNAWECDIMSHMNVQFYASRLTEAEALFAHRIGAGENQTILRPSEHRFRFVGELTAGEATTAKTMKLSAPGQRLATRTQLGSGGKIAALMESDLVVSAPSGEVINPPEQIQRRIDAISTSGPFNPVWIAGDWSPDAATLERMTVLGRQEVTPWELDHTGAMPPRFFFARMASSVSFLMSAMGLERPFMQHHELGRAAVGYRLRYLRWPRAGDCLELRSCVALVGEKNWRFRHCFVDIADGAQVCTVEAVLVLLDLVGRRSVPLPEDIRARALAVAI